MQLRVVVGLLLLFERVIVFKSVIRIKRGIIIIISESVIRKVRGVVEGIIRVHDKREVERTGRGEGVESSGAGWCSEGGGRAGEERGREEKLRM